MDDSAEDLLQAWFDYWKNNDTMPANLPDSLHTRSAVFLAQKKYERDLSVMHAKDGNLDEYLK